MADCHLPARRCRKDPGRSQRRVAVSLQPGGREFGTRIGIEVAEDAVWEKQELLSPRVPIVRTFRKTADLEIVEEAFAVTDLLPAVVPASHLSRLDSGTNERLGQTACRCGSLAQGHRRSHGRKYPVCRERPKRRVARRRAGVVRRLVEGNRQARAGAARGRRGAKTVDTVADIGQNRAAAFWFDARDANGDGKIDIAVEAAPQAADKNTILNGLWVFPRNQPPRQRGAAGRQVEFRCAGAHERASIPGGPPRNDLILVQRHQHRERQRERFSRG